MPSRCRADLVAQGRRRAVDARGVLPALFDRNPERATWAIREEDSVDAADVTIERACAALLTDATRQGAELGEQQLLARC